MARFVSAVTGLRLFCDKKRQEGQERRRRGRVWWAWARLQGGGGDLLACVLALLRAPRGVDGLVHLPLTRLCPRLLRGLGRFLGLHLVYRAVEVLEQLEARGEHLVEGRRPAALGVRGPEVRARQLHERLEALLASLPLPQLLLEQVGPNRHAMQLCHARARWVPGAVGGGCRARGVGQTGGEVKEHPGFRTWECHSTGCWAYKLTCK